MSIGEYLKSFPNLEIELLLSHILEKDKEFIFTHPELKLEKQQEVDLKKLIEKRFKGEPIAYLLGYKYFCGLKYEVSRATLIPRPETEDLVEYTKEFILQKKNRLRLLDVGTGSGCIAITIKKHLEKFPEKNISVFAVDISNKALATARINAKIHKTHINFFQSNLFKKVPGKYDVITANLPYVPNSYYIESKDLKFEPKNALTDGTNTGKIYKFFFQQAFFKINKGAGIFLETDPGLIENITEWANFYLKPKRLEIKKDIQGIDRFVNIFM